MATPVVVACSVRLARDKRIRVIAEAVPPGQAFVSERRPYNVKS
jgi:hypothetical protein